MAKTTYSWVIPVRAAKALPRPTDRQDLAVPATPSGLPDLLISASEALGHSVMTVDDAAAATAFEEGRNLQERLLVRAFRDNVCGHCFHALPPRWRRGERRRL